MKALTAKGLIVQGSAGIAAALSLVLAGSAAVAQVTYNPPDTPYQRFGGDVGFGPVGPYAGFWPSRCRVLAIQAREHVNGPPSDPRIDTELKRFVAGTISATPDVQDLSPTMADVVRKQMAFYWPSLARLGPPSSTKPIGPDSQGNTVYVVEQQGDRTHWNIAVNPAGQIDSAIVCAGGGL
jgi:hypothetical protein